jgi:8-oxo-dGTP diphosphatase
MPNTGPETPARRAIQVVAGVLRNETGEVLLAQRLAPKRYAGQWEFPGGKLEGEESARQALDRELSEELGIRVLDARRLIRIHHDYPEFTVVLDTWVVTRFEGTPESREGQPLAWAAVDRLHEWALLGADAPIISALRLPDEYAFTPPDASAADIIAALPKWPVNRLLRLRRPALDDDTYAALAATILPELRRLGIRLLLDRHPGMVGELGAHGWHADGTELARTVQRPEEIALCIASCHSREDLAAAAGLGFDAAVLGPLNATPTHPGVDPLGLSVFEQVMTGCNLPVYAIGGVGPQDIANVHLRGGQGVAGIRAFWPHSAVAG